MQPELTQELSHHTFIGASAAKNERAARRLVGLGLLFQPRASRYTLTTKGLYARTEHENGVCFGNRRILDVLEHVDTGPRTEPVEAGTPQLATVGAD